MAAEVAAALGRSHPVFALSARDGFDAAVAGDRAGVTASGLARLSGALSEFLASELVDARLVAFGRAVSRLVDGIEDRDALERSALALSDAELADRLVRFTAAVDAEMRSLAEDRVLLAETVHEIDRDLTAWFAEAGRQIPSDASARFEALSTTVALRQLEPRLDAEVQAVVEERFGAVRPVLAGRLDAAWAEVAQVFATKAQARVDAIRASAGAEFGTTLHPVHLPTVDEEPDRFWFLFSRPELPDADLMRLLRLLLPHRLVRRRLVTAANRRLALELDKHAGRARADLSQRLAATHRRLEAELVTFVTTVAEEIHRATASAVDQRRDLADRDSALAARSRRVHDAVAAARTACARTAGQGPRTPPAT